MKKGIHPQVFADAKTTCISCSEVYKIPATVKEQQVEVCANCHPVYTGQIRGIMASGRVDRFRKLQAEAKKKKEEIDAKPPKKSALEKKLAKKKA